MARPLRPQFPGAHYHVIARGNARELVFRDDSDRTRFLTELARVSARLSWGLLAYCLMDNHYHLAIETPTASLARGMRDLNGSYAQAFNRRHDRVGHVFQARYKAMVVDRHGYLLEVVRYIVLNPVRAGLCRAPGDWPWSSYRAMLGVSAVIPQVAVESVLSQFGSRVTSARAAYEEFVAAALPAPRASKKRESGNPVIVGDERFATEVVNRTGCISLEVPRKQRTVQSLDRYQREAASRDEAIRRAYASGTYSLVAIGSHFGLHYSTVSKICRGRALS